VKKKSREAVPAAASRAIEAQPDPTDSNPRREEIARLAYSYWEARGGRDGSPEADWFRAEQELRTRK
jgi:hypothetical protein